MLEASGKLTLTQATKIIETDERVSDVTTALTTLGYKITWRGINSEQAEVSKIPRSA